MSTTSIFKAGELVRALNGCILSPIKLPANATKDQWSHWSSIILTTLRMYNIDSLVLKEQSNEKPQTQTQTQTDLKDDEKETLSDEVKLIAAYQLMLILMDPNLFSAIEHQHKPGDASKLYSLLRDRFAPNTQLTGSKAAYELSNFQLKPNETIQEAANRIQGLSDQLEQFKNYIESSKSIALYQALPEDYKQQIGTTLFNDPTFTFDRLVTTLNNYEDVKKLNKSSPANYNNTFSSAYHLKHTNHNIDSNSNSNHNSAKYCEICEKTGHDTKHCYFNAKNANNKIGVDSTTVDNIVRQQLKSNNINSNRTYSNNNKQKYKNIEVVAANHLTIDTAVSVSNNSNSKTTTFIIDSGSAIHTCNDKSLLRNVRTINSLNATGATGNSTICNEIGELHLGPYQHPQLQYPIMIVLKNVYYSPKFKANLISVRKLIENNFGFSATFKETYITLPTHNNIRIMCSYENGVSVIKQQFHHIDQSPQYYPTCSVTTTTTVNTQQVQQENNANQQLLQQSVPATQQAVQHSIISNDLEQADTNHNSNQVNNIVTVDNSDVSVQRDQHNINSVNSVHSTTNSNTSDNNSKADISNCNGNSTNANTSKKAKIKPTSKSKHFNIKTATSRKLFPNSYSTNSNSHLQLYTVKSYCQPNSTQNHNLIVIEVG
jgi:gag-polypeptide of LTR copia-type